MFVYFSYAQTDTLVKKEEKKENQNGMDFRCFTQYCLRCRFGVPRLANVYYYGDGSTLSESHSFMLRQLIQQRITVCFVFL